MADEERTGNCQDCGVAVGETHDDGCDVARCLETGRQRLSCNVGHDCGRDVWTGRRPGEAECEEFGWWVTWRITWNAFIPPDGLPRPEQVDTGDPWPDLNRLYTEATWDRERRRWVR